MQVLFSMRSVLICVVTLTLNGCQTPPPTIPPASLRVKPTPLVIPEAQTVAFCDLVSSPQLYNQKIVRTEAIAARMTFEVVFLYAQKCNHSEAWMDFEFDNNKAYETLAPLMPVGRDDQGQVNVTIVGRFDGPSKEGYGHLNASRFHFLIMAVEKAEAVPPEVPWPWVNKK